MHEPRLWKSLLCLILGAGAFAAADYTFWYNGDAGLYVLAGVLGMVGLAELVLIFLASSRDTIYAQTEKIKAMSQLTPEQWREMGLTNPPMLRVKWEGEPVYKVDDSDILLDDFIRFLQDSNRIQTSPYRNWQKNTREKTAWQNIYAYLVSRRMVVPDSDAGNHSIKWVANWWGKLYDWYVIPFTRVEETPSPTPLSPPSEPESA
jgi:hypothetical protein